MRDLTADEKTIVAGGFWEDYEDEAGFIARLSAERQARADYICGGPLAFKEPSLEEVLIKAAKMTEQEKSAYDHAAKRAEATLLIVEALAGGALAWFAGISSAAQKGVLFAVGYVPGKIYVGEFREKLLQSMIDYEYRLDGMDGKYDGIVDPNYRHNI